MRFYRKFLKIVTIPLSIVLFCLVSFAGVRLLMAALHGITQPFRTFPLLIAFVLSYLLQYLIHDLGHLLFPRLMGGKVIAWRLFGQDYVWEGNSFQERESVPELDLCQVLVSASSHRRSSAILSVYGGALLNLISALIFCLILFLFPGSGFGSMLLSGLFLLGLYFFLFSGIPLMAGSVPNDASKAFILRHDELSLSSYLADLSQLERYAVAKKEGEVELLPEEEMDLSADQPNTSMTMFRAAFLLRCYEILLWQGHTGKASAVLTNLYLHQKDLPAEWQRAIMEEASYVLSQGNDPEGWETSDLLMVKVLKRELKEDTSSRAARCVYAWSTRQRAEQGDVGIRQSRALRLSRQIAFAYPRACWKRLVLSDE